MDWCLVTDIDGTLIDEAESTAELRRRVLEARAGLARAGARLHWVVATGRTYASTCEVLRERVLGALGMATAESAAAMETRIRMCRPRVLLGRVRST